MVAIRLQTQGTSRHILERTGRGTEHLYKKETDSRTMGHYPVRLSQSFCQKKARSKYVAANLSSLSETQGKETSRRDRPLPVR